MMKRREFLKLVGAAVVAPSLPEPQVGFPRLGIEESKRAVPSTWVAMKATRPDEYGWFHLRVDNQWGRAGDPVYTVGAKND